MYYDYDAEALIPLADVIHPQQEQTQPTGIRGFFAKIRDFFIRIVERIGRLFD